MQDKTRLKLKIISSLLTCLLSLFSLVALTLSWFSYNDKTHGGGMAVEGTNDTDILGYTFYAVKKVTSSSGTTEESGFGLEKISSSASPSLGAYDALENNYSLVVKIYIAKKSEGETLTIQAETNTNYFLGDSGYPLLPPKVTEPTLPNDTEKSYTNVLSSVVGFAALTTAESEKMQNGTLQTLPSGNRLSSFVGESATGATHTLTPSVPIRQGESSDTLATTEDTYNGKACESVCVYITYNPLLISTVFAANIANTDMYVENESGDVYPIPFVCDFALQANVQ